MECYAVVTLQFEGLICQIREKLSPIPISPALIRGNQNSSSWHNMEMQLLLRNSCWLGYTFKQIQPIIWPTSFGSPETRVSKRLSSRCSKLLSQFIKPLHETASVSLVMNGATSDGSYLIGLMYLVPPAADKCFWYKKGNFRFVQLTQFGPTTLSMRSELCLESLPLL